MKDMKEEKKGDMNTVGKDQKSPESAFELDGGILDAMFAVGAHYGYSKSRRHPSMKAMIFGVKNRVEIIDLEKTAHYLAKAEAIVRALGAAGKTLLFVGTKNEARKIVRETAESLEMPFVSERWVGGMFTNFEQIKTRIARLKELREKRLAGELEMYTKKERLLLQMEEDKLTKFFGGIENMERLPAAVFLVDPRHEESAVKEARRMKIPLLALMNSDCDFKSAQYPIPANDASIASIGFFANRIAEAYREGMKEKEEAKEVKEIKETKEI